jgi:hypothetical protein
MAIVLDGSAGIANDGGYTGDGVVFADTTPANTLVTTTGGNVGVGTASPSFALDIATASANIRVAPSTTTNNALTRYINAGGTGFVGLDNSAAGISTAYALNVFHTGAYPVVFGTNGAERARIDSSGNLLVGTTNLDPTFNRVNGTVITNSGNIYARSAGAWDKGLSTTSGPQIIFYTDNGARVQAGSITSSGSTTSFNTSSDYRLKQDIAPMTGALTRVAELKPVTYKWKTDGADGEGFIAHELAEVCPAAVYGEKDAVDADGNPQYQGIDTSFLVATLTAAIQEQQAIITALTARVEALEGTQP